MPVIVMKHNKAIDPEIFKAALDAVPAGYVPVYKKIDDGFCIYFRRPYEDISVEDLLNETTLTCHLPKMEYFYVSAK